MGGYNNNGYNNNRNNNNNGYNNNGYNNNRYNNNGYNNNGNNRSNQPPVKRSGAVYTVIKKGNFEGNTIVNAWRSTKLGIMTAVVAPYAGEGKRGLEIVNSEKNEYQKMICTITNKTLGTSQIYPVLMNLKTKTIVISELGLVISQNGSGVTSKGKRVTGYFGRFTR